MPAWLKAAFAYFAAIFALGFILGTVRTLVLMPRLGELAAVLLELPLMLAASWWVSRRLTERWRVAARPVPRLAMGGAAFALLISAEWALAVLLFGVDSSQWRQQFATVVGALGLAAQILFGLIPALQLHSARPHRGGT